MFKRNIGLSEELKSKYGNYTITNKDLAKIISDKSETDFEVLKLVFKKSFSIFDNEYDEYIFLIKKEDLKNLISKERLYNHLVEYNKDNIKYKFTNKNIMVIDIKEPENLKLVNSFVIKDFNYKIEKFINKNCKENICLLKCNQIHDIDIDNFNWFVPYIINKHKLEGYSNTNIMIGDIFLKSMQGRKDKETQLNFQLDYIYQCIDENIEKIMAEQDH